MKANFRRDTISGLIPIDGLIDGEILFTEWWNGEGIDFEIELKADKSKKQFSLHADELENIAAIAAYIGLLDQESISDKLYQWETDEKSHQKELEEFKRKFEDEIPF